MMTRTLEQLEARWQQLNRRMWAEEKAMLAGTITRAEQIQADAQRQASRRALEIEARRMEARDEVVQTAG